MPEQRPPWSRFFCGECAVVWPWQQSKVLTGGLKAFPEEPDEVLACPNCGAWWAVENYPPSPWLPKVDRCDWKAPELTEAQKAKYLAVFSLN